MQEMIYENNENRRETFLCLVFLAFGGESNIRLVHSVRMANGGRRRCVSADVLTPQVQVACFNPPG